METKHTPGPWTVDDMGNGSLLETNHKWGIGATAKSTYRVAVIEGLGEQSEADARLIAAAPELLDALRRVVEISDRRHDAWDAAKSAIAKALGSDCS